MDQKFNIKLGWKPSKKDNRDLKYDIPLTSIILPSKFDLRYKIKHVFEQNYNDCVANGTSNLIHSFR